MCVLLLGLGEDDLVQRMSQSPLLLGVDGFDFSKVSKLLVDDKQTSIHKLAELSQTDVRRICGVNADVASKLNRVFVAWRSALPGSFSVF